MTTLSKLGVAVLAVVAIAYLSCNKDSGTAPRKAFDLEYKVLNAHHTITAVSIVGQAGDTTSADVSSQTDTLWSTGLSIVSRPFTAGMTVKVNNTTGANLDFTLQILADGVVQNSTEKSIPPQAATDVSLNAVIQ